MLGKEVDRLDEILDERVAHEVLEGEADEAELDPQATAQHLRLVGGRRLEVEVDQAVDVGPGAEAAAARLNPEEVVEQRYHEVGMEHAYGPSRARVADPEGHDRHPRQRGVAEEQQPGALEPGAQGALQVACLQLLDHAGSDLLLEPEGEAGADRLDDRRRPAFLAHHGVGMVGLVLGRDVDDRAAAGDRGEVVGEEVALGDEDAGRAGAARQLVRREAHRVLVGELALLDVRNRVHLDWKMGRGRRIVPAGERAVAVEQDGDCVDVRDDAGHVRRCREGPDLERPGGVALELRPQVIEVEPALRVLADDDDLRRRLSPQQLVRVVLERAQEDERPLARVEPEDSREQVDGGGGARAAEDHGVVHAAAYGPVDHPPRVLSQLRRTTPVAEASVCVFAYSGSTRLRMTSSMKASERPEAV